MEWEGRPIRNPSGDSGSLEKLDSKYKIVEERKQKKFWVVGRVFMLLWTEPARDGHQDLQRGPPTTGSSNKFSKTYLEGTAFSEIRRFVVLSVGHGNTICSPIHTYNGQATWKPNLPDRMQHAIIYTSEKAPPEHMFQAPDKTLVPENLIKDAIKVKSEHKGPEGHLDPLSRINYSKIYTVENYVRVLNIGVVVESSIPSLLHSSFVKPRASPVEQPSVPSRRAGSRKEESKGGGKGRDKESGRRRRR